MTMFYSRENQFHDITGDDAHRAWLISRNQPPIVHHSGDMPWKRLRVLARLGARHVMGFFATLRVALVADKMRRAQDDLSRHGIRVPASTGRDRSVT
ncbi:MAG: hypothetical protein JWQ94_4754 [Tardiphaga sp.]|jgi:hypothetical protein|nr:hypothetical protein [Tardiphaga sp.]